MSSLLKRVKKKKRKKGEKKKEKVVRDVYTRVCHARYLIARGGGGAGPWFIGVGEKLAWQWCIER